MSCCTFLLALWPSYFLELCSRPAPAAAELEIFPSEDRRARQRCRRGAAHLRSAEKGAAHRPSAEKGAAHRRSERRQLSPTSKTRKSREPREVPRTLRSPDTDSREINPIGGGALVAPRGGKRAWHSTADAWYKASRRHRASITARSCIRATRSFFEQGEVKIGRSRQAKVGQKSFHTLSPFPPFRSRCQ